MKAVRLNQWGNPLDLEDVEQPVPDDDQVLVRIHAASINPFDAAIAAGYLQGMASVPMTMGTDFSGEVAAVGANVQNFKPGDAVYGLSVLGSGTFAEYTTVKPSEIAKKPQSVDFVTAAAAPLPSMAAWKSLYELLQVKSGERLLIIGAAGAVGGIATQLAKRDGVFVYGTDIPQKAEHAIKLGVDQFISSQERFEDIVQNVDAVLDLVGGEMTERAYNVLRSGGRYVTSLLAETPQEEPTRRGIKSMGLAAYPSGEILMKMAELIDAGQVQVFVNRTFPLEEANTAMLYRYQLLEPGKVVFVVLDRSQR